MIVTIQLITRAARVCRLRARFEILVHDTCVLDRWWRDARWWVFTRARRACATRMAIARLVFHARRARCATVLGPDQHVAHAPTKAAAVGGSTGAAAKSPHLRVRSRRHCRCLQALLRARCPTAPHRHDAVDRAGCGRGRWRGCRGWRGRVWRRWRCRWRRWRRGRWSSDACALPARSGSPRARSARAALLGAAAGGEKVHGALRARIDVRSGAKLASGAILTLVRAKAVLARSTLQCRRRRGWCRRRRRRRRRRHRHARSLRLERRRVSPGGTCVALRGALRGSKGIDGAGRARRARRTSTWSKPRSSR